MSTPLAPPASPASSTSSDLHPLIAFAARKFRGKSTAAQALVNMGYVMVNFADPIKEFGEICGLPHESLYGSEAEKNTIIPDLGISGRHFMQVFGTNIMRENAHKFGFDMGGLKFWSFIMRNVIRQHLKNGKKVVIGDLRFPDEAQMIRSLGGLIVKIERDGPMDDHPSEVAVDQIDADIVYPNVKSLIEFQVDMAKIPSRGLSRTDH